MKRSELRIKEERGRRKWAQRFNIQRLKPRLPFASYLLPFAFCLLTPLVFAQTRSTASLPKWESLLNGLSIAIVERPGAETVTARLIIKSGAAFDLAGKAGLASFTADMLAMGAEGLSRQNIEGLLDKTKSKLAVNTGWDATTITITTTPMNLDLALELLGKLVATPSFSDVEFQDLKKKRIEEIKKAQADAAQTAADVFADELYGYYPYGHTILGTPESLARITRGDLILFHRRHYLANNAALAVVGGASFEDAMSAVRSGLGRLLKGAPPPSTFKPPQPLAATRVVLVDKPDAQFSQVVFGHFGISRTDEKYFAVRMMNYILGGSLESRLSKRLINELGYTKSINSNFDARALGGPFTISAVIENRQVYDAIVESLKIVELFRKGEITPAELQSAKDYFINSYNSSIASDEGLAQELTDIELYRLGRDYIINYAQRIGSITTEDIKQAAAVKLRPDVMLISVVGSAAQLQESLKKLGPVEVIPFDKRPEAKKAAANGK